MLTTIIIFIICLTFDAATGSITFLLIFVPYFMLTIMIIFIICLTFDAATGSVMFSTVFFSYLILIMIMIFIVGIEFDAATSSMELFFWIHLWFAFCSTFISFPVGPPDDSLTVSCSFLNDSPDVGELWWCHFTDGIWYLSCVDNNHNDNNFVLSHLMRQLFLWNIFSKSICWCWHEYLFKFRSVYWFDHWLKFWLR